MKNICPHMLTLDWAALLGLGILILLIYVFHAQQRCYRLFSLSCSEMEGGGKKRKQRKKRNQKSLQCTEHNRALAAGIQL